MAYDHRKQTLSGPRFVGAAIGMFVVLGVMALIAGNSVLSGSK